MCNNIPIPLFRYHLIILTILVRAVGWEGYHLNQFIAGKTYYAKPSDDAWVVGMQEDASKCTIGSLLSMVKSKIKWEYDFGDSWVHEITLVEKQAVDDKQMVKVELLKGSGACPPEDYGGVCGYRHLLNVLKNPADEEYEEMIEWLGGGFDPKSFSLTAARNKVKDIKHESITSYFRQVLSSRCLCMHPPTLEMATTQVVPGDAVTRNSLRSELIAEACLDIK